MKSIKTYVVSILIPLLVGGLSAFLTRNNMMLYEDIIKPPLAPPAILFPIVWTILYILMGIGAARVYLKRDIMPKEVAEAKMVYFLQLAVNFFWSLIFFNQRAFLAAFLWLVLLWLLIVLMLVKFRKVDLPAAVINIPYLIWVTFAGYLSLAIYLLNR
ncbi:MAG: tryptophan-rich sensory protein [Clostridia bacterium]|nr:tryptophan-rich sensory protein [Clostridia bacterium]